MTCLEAALTPACPWIIFTSRIEMLPATVRQTVGHNYAFVGAGIGLRRDVARPEPREQLPHLRYGNLRSFW